jgi:hypothetical protein
MPDHVVLLSVPGLRASDLAHMPSLRSLAQDQMVLGPSFPCVTCPVQVNMTTGQLPSRHGVIANGFYWRDKQHVEMWTAWNEAVQAPQIWDVLHQQRLGVTSAVWFPLLSKGCGADYICTPAPIHNPDGSESLWCYTRPSELYGELRDRLGHFPLQHFWGPLANIKSTAWIADSAVVAAQRWRPHFFYIYLPHLDYAAQKTGPDSPQAIAALSELDGVIARLVLGMHSALAPQEPLWLVASEYALTAVDHVAYPNRLLRQQGLLAVRDDGQGEVIDVASSAAWALVDHQFSHLFVKDADPQVIRRVQQLFTGQAGIAEVLAGDERGRYDLIHERSGEVVLISAPNSWQAYYYWLDDSRAPKFARTVDIHRKVGYDPVELFFDPAARGIPLTAELVKGSHGAPARQEQQRGVILCSQRGVLVGQAMADIDVAGLVLQQFGV